MIDTEFKQKIRQAYASASTGMNGVVAVLADHEPQYMTVSLSEIEAAASRLEEGARRLRDVVAITRAETQS